MEKIKRCSECRFYAHEEDVQKCSKTLFHQKYLLGFTINAFGDTVAKKLRLWWILKKINGALKRITGDK